MLEMMSGRMTSFNIRIRISPGKPKYCLSREERDAYSLTNTPKPIPERSRGNKQIINNSWCQLKTGFVITASTTMMCMHNWLCISGNVTASFFQWAVGFHPPRIHCWSLFFSYKAHMYSTQ